jgi:predicted flap endonuclease-1-like 5' DNA nuclease
MKLKLFIAALIVAFAAPVMADGGSAGNDGVMQVAQKKKQKRKGKTAAAATAGAAAVAAGTAATAEPAPQAAAVPAPTPAPAEAAKSAPSTNVVKTDLYTVVDGIKVDAKTLDGFKIWRAAACDRCHGANQEGMVGPSLLESIKKLTKAEFVTVIKEGRLEKGMPPWNTNDQVMKGMDNLYAYLKGRSDGAITKAKVSAME